MTSRYAVVAALAVIAAPAAADADVVARGAVVKVEASEIYVNLGRQAGVRDGARLRIKRTIKLKHPVSRRTVTDWLPVGGADVTDAGEQLSMAILDDDMLAQVKTGDVVEIYVVRDDAPVEPEPEAEPEPEPPRDDGTPLPAIDADTAAVLAVWQSQRSATLDVRIAAWEGYLAAHATSPYADPVRADLELLRRHRDIIEPPSTTTVRHVTGVDHDGPTRAAAGTAVPLVFVLDDPSTVESAWLHVRTVDAPTYTRTLLEREHDRYLRGAIPAAAVVAPGVEYFLEVISPAGEPGVAISPTQITVPSAAISERFAPRRARTRVSTIATWMDFATFDSRDGDHTDRFFQLQSDVTYRLDGGLAGLSAGLGTIRGEGGFAETVWTPVNPAPVTAYQYGYAEAEVRLARQLGAAVRLIAGVGKEGLGFGIEGRFRVGEIDHTNLSLVANAIDEVGFLTEVRFQVDPFGRVPVGLSVGITDLPAQGDLAARLGIDLGVRTVSWLEPVLRVTYQGRTVEHSGVGLGLGLNFHW